MVKINLNREKCIGCSLCVSSEPNLFTMGEDDKAELINTTLDASAIENATFIKDIVEMCPVHAIDII